MAAEDSWVYKVGDWKKRSRPLSPTRIGDAPNSQVLHLLLLLTLATLLAAERVENQGVTINLALSSAS